MTASARSFGTALAPWHGAGRRHPEWWVGGLIGCAWLALAAASLVRAASQPSSAGGYAAMFVCPIAPTLGVGMPDLGTVVGLPGAGTMAVAMMAPLVLPQLHHVGVSGLWSRRTRGPAFVLAGFVGAWIPVIWAIDLVVTLGARAVGPGLTVVATVAVAAAWHHSVARARRVRGCARSIPLPPRGRRADVAALAYGVLLARSCIVSCVALMAVVAAAGHGLLAMAAVAAVQLHERRTGRSRPRRLPATLVLVMVGVLALAQTSA